jgi:uncharacterized coiled-coil protein SlyX
MNKLYFPINHENLAFYYESAIIKPASYIANRKEDLQSIFSDYLVLSNKPFSDSTNCSLELVFNEDEDLFKISKNFYYFTKPLPISRVKNIVFKNIEEKENKVVDFKMGSIAKLIEEHIILDSTSKALSEKELPKKLSSITPKTDWTKAINSYNSILGGLALMRLGSNEYADDYFSILSALNELIEDKGSRTKANNNLKKLIAPPKKHQSDEFYKLAYEKKIDKKHILTLGKERNLGLKEFGNSIKLKGVPWGYIYLAIILSTYDEVSGTKTISSFIEDIGKGINGNSKFIKDKRDIIALYFGINKGYKELRSEYKISNEVFNVKFQLDSQLDYYTIESSYQYAINNNHSNGQFTYLDSFCPSSGPYDDMLPLNKKKVGFGELSERYLDKIKKETSPLFNDLLSGIFKVIGEIFLNEELRPLEEDLSKKDAKIYELEKSLKEKDIKLDDLSSSVTAQNKELAKLRGEVDELHEELLKTKSQIRADEGKNKSIDTSLVNENYAKKKVETLTKSDLKEKQLNIQTKVDSGDAIQKNNTLFSEILGTEQNLDHKEDLEAKREKELDLMEEDELNDLCKKYKIKGSKKTTKIRNILKKEFKK